MLAAHLISFFLSKPLSKPQEDPTRKVDEVLQAMCLHDNQLKDISAQFQAEMKKGLSVKSRAAAAVKMLPTHVCSTPDGSEKGQSLGLDLRESVLKVQQIKLGEGVGFRRKKVKTEEKILPIHKELLNGRAEELFDFVSGSLKQFMHEKNISFKKKYPLAFTFSFPCEQPALNQGLLLNWTKNVRTLGLQGKDVANALKAAIERTGGMDIDILALVNDSVATMMTCGFDDQQCEVGLIIGTGTNACYMEERCHIDLVEGDEGRMCVNTEWGAFGDDGSLNNYVTEFDREVDAASNNPGKQIFEKMVSSMYLGELVRLAVLKLAKQGLLFKGCVSKALKTKGKITTTHAAAMEECQSGLQNTRHILTELGLTPSEDDCIAVQHVSTVVSYRSSNLVAACLSAILARIKQNRRSSAHITVGVNGEMYKMHPQYSKRLQKAVHRLTPQCSVRFVTCGSSIGAALVTAATKEVARQRQQVDTTLGLFTLSQEQLLLVKSRMQAGLESGLNQHHSSEMRMLPSFVYNVPDGTESGQYIGLELEGTHFRAMLVNIKNGFLHNTNRYHKIYEVPSELMQGSGEELFDHLARCVSDFLDYVGMKNTCLPAAFTLSFPCKHTGIDKGTLLSWTKCLKATGCEGHDVVTMLREAIRRHAMFDLNIVAVVNDAVGTMIGSAYEDPQVEVGLIVGTGVNVCYMEEVKNIKYAVRKGEEVADMTDAETAKNGADKQRMCINTECGQFGDNGSLHDIFTPYDIQVDQNSLHPGKQRFEKLTSEMYLGEVVRQILLDLMSKGLLFRGHKCTALKTPGLFKSHCLSQIESDRVAVLQVRSILQQLGLQSNCDDSVIVKEVCCTVSRRAAQLCGAGVAAVVDKMRENRGVDHLNITVAVYGALYKLHPHFSRILNQTTKSLAPQCTVTFLPSEEGAGRGAVLIAAAAARQSQEM